MLRSKAKGGGGSLQVQQRRRNTALKDTLSLGNRNFVAVVVVVVVAAAAACGDRVSVCSFGCPGTHLLDQAGLQLRDLPTSAS